MIRHSSAIVSRLAAISPGSRSASLKSPAVPASRKPRMKTSAAIAPASSGLSFERLQVGGVGDPLEEDDADGPWKRADEQARVPLEQVLGHERRGYVDAGRVAHGPCGPYAAWRSGRQPLRAPAVGGAPVDQPVVHPARAGPARTPPTPGARGSRPTPRASARAVGVARSASSYAASSSSRPDDDARLVRGPGAELGAARADGEVGVDRRPAGSSVAVPSTRTWRSSGCQGKSSAHARVAGQLAALAGAGVGVEDEAVLGRRP